MKTKITILILLCLAGITMKAQIPQLWGLTYNCGINNSGSIIKINEDGTGFQTLYSFDTLTGIMPTGNLLMASDGKLYGLLYYGGTDTTHHSGQSSAAGSGVLFSYDPVYNTYNDLYNFDKVHGLYPTGSLIQLSSGKLYGSTYLGGIDTSGVIFSYNPATNVYSDLYEFQNKSTGTNPKGSLVQANNSKLYGVTYSGGDTSFIHPGGGTIYCFDPTTNTCSDVYNFNKLTGWAPKGNLIQGNDGKLYGTTSYGGDTVGFSAGKGVIFSFDPTTNSYTDLYNETSLSNFSSLIQATNGKLYGTTDAGKIFSFDIGNNTLSYIYNSTFLTYGSLLQGGNGKIFGTTNYTIFSIDSLGSNVSSWNVLHCIMNGAFIELPADTGIPEAQKNDSKVLVFPNPSSNNITISNQSGIRNYELRITDVLGNTVYHQAPSTSTQSTIDLSRWSKGIYLVHLQSDKESLVKRVVVE